MKVKLLALALAAWLVAVGQAREDTKKDLDRVQGTWTFTAHEVDGQAQPAEQLKEMTITFAGDKFTVKRGDQVVQAGTNKFDATKKPKTVDATVTEGDQKGTTMLGIYELKGDTIRFCFDPKGEKRPTEFKSPTGSGLISGTLKKSGS
jgi:uncharacterized protein (TIGR03067 family)